MLLENIAHHLCVIKILTYLFYTIIYNFSFPTCYCRQFSLTKLSVEGRAEQRELDLIWSRIATKTCRRRKILKVARSLHYIVACWPIFSSKVTLVLVLFKFNGLIISPRESYYLFNKFYVQNYLICKTNLTKYINL